MLDIEFFNNINAILNFEYIAMHFGLSKVIEPFWTATNRIYGNEQLFSLLWITDKCSEKLIKQRKPYENKWIRMKFII